MNLKGEGGKKVGYHECLLLLESIKIPFPRTYSFMCRDLW